MKSLAESAVTALLLVMPAAASLQPASEAAPHVSLVPFALQADSPQQQCWIEHTQVQPGPLPQRRGFVSLTADDPRTWRQPGSRPGSEHWNVADLQQACRAQWLRRNASSSVAADFLITP